MHCPFAGFVWHNVSSSGSAALPVSAVTTMGALAPTFAVATASAPVPPRPGMETMPPTATAIAMMSGVGPADDVSRSVLTPGVSGAGLVFAQSKAKWMSVAGNA